MAARLVLTNIELLSVWIMEQSYKKSHAPLGYNLSELQAGNKKLFFKK